VVTIDAQSPLKELLARYSVSVFVFCAALNLAGENRGQENESFSRREVPDYLVGIDADGRWQMG
jgi:hypothetical protein